jgi:hypothetical protein
MPDDRPSFGQALAESGATDAGGFDAPAETAPDADGASASSVDSLPASETPALATQPPEPGESPSTPGPLPFDRHKAILEKARADHETALKAERERFAWAQDVPPEQAAQVEHAAALRSYAARTLGTRAAAAAQPVQPTGPDLGQVLEVDGIPLYTKQQQDARDQWLIQRVVDAVTQEVGGRIAPVESVAQALAQAKKDQADQEQRMTSAKTLMARATKWEGFAEHQKELAAELPAYMAANGYADEQVKEALYDLYIERVVPKLRTTAQAGLLRDLKTRAGELGSSPAGAKNPAPTTHARPTWDNVFSQV